MLSHGQPQIEALTRPFVIVRSSATTNMTLHHPVRDDSLYKNKTPHGLRLVVAAAKVYKNDATWCPQGFWRHRSNSGQHQGVRSS